VDIAENIRRLKKMAAKHEAPDDEDDDGDNDDIDVEVGGDAAASDEVMADAAEGVISSVAGQAAEEGEIDDALPIRTIAAQ
jgi:hypothetical protein